MGIRSKAAEFACLPVIEYDPAVGLVLPTMPRREFRREGPPEAFRAVALDGERLVTELWEAGSPVETDVRTFPTAVAAREEYHKLIVSIRKEGGYAERKPEGASVPEALLAALRANPDD